VRRRDPRLARFVPWDSIGCLETEGLLGFRPVGADLACADEGVLNMHTAAFVTLVAIVVGFAAPTRADDRPSDPFGNYTVEMNEEAYLFGVWESLRDQVLLDRAHFHLCIESNNESNNTDCAAVSTLTKIVEEARQNQAKLCWGTSIDRLI